MIEKFKVGYYYRLKTIRTRPASFNREGLMDYMLDGKWHKCVSTSVFSSDAFFEEDLDSPSEDVAFMIKLKTHWTWVMVMDDIEEKQLNDGKQMLLDL